MTEVELMRERTALIAEMARIDARREQLKAEIVRENRLPGVSKYQIALKQTERAAFLNDREDVRQKISEVNEKIKALRRSACGTAVPETDAQRFVEVARRSLPREMFHDLMDRARALSGMDDDVSPPQSGAHFRHA